MRRQNDQLEKPFIQNMKIPNKIEENRKNRKVPRLKLNSPEHKNLARMNLSFGKKNFPAKADQDNLNSNWGNSMDLKQTLNLPKNKAKHQRRMRSGPKKNSKINQRESGSFESLFDKLVKIKKNAIKNEERFSLPVSVNINKELEKNKNKEINQEEIEDFNKIKSKSESNFEKLNSIVKTINKQRGEMGFMTERVASKIDDSKEVIEYLSGGSDPNKDRRVEKRRKLQQ